MSGWFDVDKEGLSKLLDRNGGKQFVVFELLQNAWDEAVTEVNVSLNMLPRRPRAILRVEDNSPEGFSNLTHAFTLFAESEKKVDPNKRGRFNLGEKFVLAVCYKAYIHTTKGKVTFHEDGTRTVDKKDKRESGSVFEGEVRMTRSECDEICANMDQLFPPDNIRTTFNDIVLSPRPAMKSFSVFLPTVISNDEGKLVRTTRKTTVSIHEVRDGEVGMIYEMGLPVVETGDKYHWNVHQKVPTNLERDNVAPSYLRTLRTLSLNRVADLLCPEDTTKAWVQEATSDDRCETDAFEKVFIQRFGEKCTAHDPSDPEANKLAMSKGFNVLGGGTLSKGQWKHAKGLGLAKPSGQVTPSPKPFSEFGDSLKTIPSEEWSDKVREFVDYAKRIGKALMERQVSVVIARDTGWEFLGACGPDLVLTMNLSRGGNRLLDLHTEKGLQRINEFLIHEFSHGTVSDHLSSEYNREQARLGAKLTGLALSNPDLFPRFENND